MRTVESGRALMQAPVSFALHEIIYDNQGKAVDYRFIDANDAFEKMTGILKERLVGCTVKEVLPSIVDDSFDWIALYADVVREKKTVSFSQFSKPLNKWYKIDAYYVKKRKKNKLMCLQKVLRRRQSLST